MCCTNSDLIKSKQRGVGDVYILFFFSPCSSFGDGHDRGPSLSSRGRGAIVLYVNDCICVNILCSV